MRRQRQRRVAKVTQGYKAEKGSVLRGGKQAQSKEAMTQRLEKLVSMGYRKGWSKEEGKGITVYLSYSSNGVPARASMVSRSHPSRPRWVNVAERWARKGEMGTYRRETTEGRKTAEEAMQKELGGRRRLWVR